jgi:hypothetical protein
MRKISSSGSLSILILDKKGKKGENKERKESAEKRERETETKRCIA